MLIAIYTMFILTIIVGLIAFKSRYLSVTSHAVSIKAYRLTQSKNLPDQVIKTTRCYNNQFEAPLLFYAVGILYISLGFENNIVMILAWLFVISRLIHATIFLTYNNVVHRMLSFMVGYLLLLILWTYLVLLYLGLL